MLIKGVICESYLGELSGGVDWRSYMEELIE